MTRTAYATCPLCEATCGLELTVDGDRITGVRGDREDPLSRGYLCPKGASLGQLDADPDRVRAPRVRRDGKLVPVGWDEAFAAVNDGLTRIIAEHGRDAVALYLGNPNVHTLAGGMYAGMLRKASGSRNVYTASTVDQMPKHVSCGYLFGNPLAIPVPDVDRTDFLLILGADPYSSNGSLWTVPDLPGPARRAARARRPDGRGGSAPDPHRPARRPARADPARHRRLPAARAWCTSCSPGTWCALGALAPHVTGVDAVRDLAVAVPAGDRRAVVRDRPRTRSASSPPTWPPRPGPPSTAGSAPPRSRTAP